MILSGFFSAYVEKIFFKFGWGLILLLDLHRWDTSRYLGFHEQVVYESVSNEMHIMQTCLCNVQRLLKAVKMIFR